DLFALLARKGIAVYLDSGTYPIARWGAERAAFRGMPVRCFAHHDPVALRSRLTQVSQRPVVVSDGFCPGCGAFAPIVAYLECVRACGGLLVLDDTQALGIFGRAARSSFPYGQGGGGSLPWHDLREPDVIVASSLAKAFGVPVAVLAASQNIIRRFEQG